jgi:cytochrome c-type biogenesis protein CcmF
LASGQKLESAGSREALFLYANLLLALFALVVLFGVSSPIFYRLATGKELSRGPEFYNPRILPIALLILLVMGVASVSPWRRGGWAGYRRQLAIPGVAGLSALAASVVVFLLGGEAARADFGSRPLAYVYLFACMSLCAFVAAIILEDYARTVAVTARRRKASPIRALVEPFLQNPRRYGGYVVHLGVVCLFLGVAFSSTFQTEYQEPMTPGDAVRFGPYTVRLASLGHDDLEADLNVVNQTRVWADLQVYEGGRLLTVLRPMRVFYASNREQPTYEVAIHSTLMRDFYALLAGFDLKAQTATVGAFVTPMVAWLWVGSLLIFIGGLAALIPMRRI